MEITKESLQAQIDNLKAQEKAAFEKLLSCMVKPDKTIIAIQQNNWKRQHIHHLSQRKWGVLFCCCMAAGHAGRHPNLPFISILGGMLCSIG